MNLNFIVRLFAVLLGLPVLSYGQIFTNIAPLQGIELINQPSDFACGVSFVDFDRDGWDDITFGTKNTPIRFYHNNNGQFELIDLEGITLTNKEIKQITWVDYDNDGDYDFMVGLQNLPYRLYVNQGDMTFVQAINSQIGLSTANVANRNIAWGDYDRDGDLDVYLAKNNSTGTGNFATDYPKMNHLYQNNNDGTFTDVTMFAGVSDSLGITYGTIWWDYDLDGWPDLYVANDKFFDNALFHNNTDGTFTNVALETGSDIIMDSMCASPADFDNDGDFDMYITNTSLGVNGVGNVLLENDNGIFTNQAPSAGLNLTTTNCWGASWLDYNNDTNLDIYVAFNSVGSGYPGLNRLQKNNGNSTFSNVNNLAGMGYDMTLAYANAIGDINNDGYPDIVSHTSHPHPAQISQSSGGNMNYLKILLEGVVSNRDGVGSLIECWTNGTRQLKYTSCGENFMGQNSFRQIFGLGMNTEVDSLIIKWNSGHSDKFYNIPANQSLHILEGSSLNIELNISGTIENCSINEVLEVGDYEDYLWSNGETSSSIEISEPGLYFVTVTTENGFQFNSDSLEVFLTPAPQPAIHTEMISCPHENDGIIEITELEANYTVLWDDDSTDLIKDNLEAGFYHILVTDNEGCSLEFEIEITEPSPLEFEVSTTQSCPNSNTGTISISNLTYPDASIAWMNGLESFELNQLEPAHYFYEIQYLNQCALTDSVEVSSFPWLSLNPIMTSPLCYGSADGSIYIDENELENIESIEWSADGVVINPENLSEGIYYYEYIDTDGCIYNDTVEMFSPDSLIVNVDYTPDGGDKLCPAPHQGYLSVEISGGTPEYNILWTFTNNDGVTTDTSSVVFRYCFFGLTELLVEDQNGCTYYYSEDNSEWASTTNLSSSNIQLYPNPSDGLFYLKGSIPSHSRISTYSSTGELIYEDFSSIELTSIDLSRFADGVYYLKIANDNFYYSTVILKH